MNDGHYGVDLIFDEEVQANRDEIDYPEFLRRASGPACTAPWSFMTVI